MKSLITFAVKRSRTVLMIFVMLILAGAWSYARIAREASPNIDIPIIIVSASHEGISPEDSERLLIRPLEQELSSIEGLKKITSSSYVGGGAITLEFEAGFDADSALTDVKDSVDEIGPDLPAEADEPIVQEVNTSLFPILVVNLWGDAPERLLAELAEEVRTDVEALPSVLEVEVVGKRSEELHLIIDPRQIESYGINLSDLTRILNASNVLIAGGIKDTGKGQFSIKIPALFETQEDILNTPIKTSGDSVVLVRDIAEARTTYEDRKQFAWFNGERSLSLEIKKRSGANIVETITAIKTTVDAMKANWPENIQVNYSQDQSRQVSRMLSDLQNNVLIAVLLIMIVIVGALGLRSGLLVGISIPGAFLSGILMLYIGGYTLNMVVLFSLILSVGLLVDGAIVVVESADRRSSSGASNREAFIYASSRMATPIIASTMTTLAAFLPLMFWPGVVGKFMVYLPMTLIMVLSASLVMSLIFMATLGAVVGKQGSTDQKVLAKANIVERGDLNEIKGVSGIYIRGLRFALKAPEVVLALAVAVLIGAGAYYGIHGKGVEFFPDVEPDNLNVTIHARGNLSVEEQNDLVREVEARILGVDGIKSVYVRSGKSSAGGEGEADAIGSIFIELLDWSDRPVSDIIIDEIKTKTNDISGLVIEVGKQESGPPSGKPVSIRVSGSNVEDLKKAAHMVASHMDNMQGLKNVTDDLPRQTVEWVINVDLSQASKFGITSGEIGNQIKLLTEGLKLTSYRPSHTRDEVDIVLRFPKADRTLEELDSLRLINSAGESIPISHFVTRTPSEAVGTISRIDQQRAHSISADFIVGARQTKEGRDMLAADYVQDVVNWLQEEAALPNSVKWEAVGEQEDQQEAQTFLGRAFIVALCIMALILVTQFNSFYHSILILTAVVLSIAGVLIGLVAMNLPFGVVMTGVGVVALAGIVVNNNIVLIDTFQHLMRDGNDIKTAILRTGALRMRPVLLTTTTTILGMVPMVAQLNIDLFSRNISVGAPSTQWWVSLATAISFGLGFSTLLTLIVTPCALLIPTRLKYGLSYLSGHIKRTALKMGGKSSNSTTS